MSWLVDLVRSHLLLRSARKFERLREEFVHDEDQKNKFWTKSLSLWSKMWAHCSCLRNPLVQFALKTLFGFISGALLVILLLLTLVLQAQMSPLKAAVLCLLLAPPLSLGLAFSSRVRCATLLVLPQLSSKRGRQALVAFAFILTLTGPVANTVRNMEETALSLTCGLHLANKGLSRLAAIVKRPMVTAKRAVEKALKVLEESLSKIKETLSGLESVISAIGEVLKSAADWLQDVADVCNSEFGTPIERCYHMFDETSKDCSDTMGPYFSWLCSVVYAGSIVCSPLSTVSLVCLAAEPVFTSISSSLSQMREKFMEDMHALFYVQVDYEQEFNADFTTDNRTVSSMLKEMTKELKETTGPILYFYHLVGGILGLMWIFVFYKAHRYHRKFRTNDRFDNFYITKEVRDVDLARVRKGKEPILPLRVSERRQYCTPGKMRLLSAEQKRLVRSLIFLFLSTINIAYSLWTDYGLFWILDLIRRNMILPKTLPEEPTVKLQVDGQGLIPDMFRNLSEALTSPEQEDKEYYQDLDPSSCLPSPNHPDFNLYRRIAFLLMLAWICAFVEPFILRLRPMILNLYYPERARARAVWLSAHILRERGGFFRDMERLAGAKKNAEPLSGKDFLEKLKDRSWVARLILGSKMRACCVVCASADADLFECEAFGCTAIYCKACFECQANTCAVCEETMLQPHIAGLELERDSEEDEPDELVVVENEEERDLLENVPLSNN